MKCPNCNVTYENGKFCPECGTQLVPEVVGNFCPQCGTENVPNAKFCIECGTKLRCGENPAAADAVKVAADDSQRQAWAASDAEYKELHDKVSQRSYIGNLRVGRSWVLPQLVSMGGQKGRFDISRYYGNVCAIDFEKCWRLMVHNFDVQRKIETADPEEYAARAGWWNKDVALAMVKYDYQLLKALIRVTNVREYCSGGPYIWLKNLKGCNNVEEQMFFIDTPKAGKWINSNRTVLNLLNQFETRIRAIAAASNASDIYAAVKDYDEHRYNRIFDHLHGQTMLPEEFVNAFAGDGAYTSMMTLVKFHNLTYSDGSGRQLSRDECIADVKDKMRQFGFDGKKMLEYCDSKFFKSGLYR